MSGIIWDVLSRVNRWWFDERRVVEDEHIGRFLSSAVKWNPRIFVVDDVVDGVYTLRGPRQVGKTTMLKLFIKDLLGSGYSGTSVIYVPCDVLRDYRELLELLVNIRRRIRGRIVIILDEVGFVDEWQRAVKVFVDQGSLRNTTIIACGSHAVDVKKGAAYLVGRRGSARHPIDRVLLPMSFREYVYIIKPGLIRNIMCLEDVLSMDPIRREAIIGELSELFAMYLITGGFPRAIDEYIKNGTISRETLSDFINYLSKDITKLGKSESLAKSVLASILRQRCNPVSWNSIAREIGISQPTAREYGDLLSRMYIIKLIYHPNRTFLGPDERKNKKLILRDPLLYHIASLWIRNFPEISINPDEIISWNIEYEAQYIVEMVVLEHISRQHTVYYWRHNKELDAVIIERGFARGIEVKWKERISRGEIRDIIRTYNKIPMKKKKLIVITKRAYEERENAVLIPAPLFLTLRGL